MLKFFNKIFRDLFTVSLILFIFLVFLEDFRPGSVTLWLNLNIILIVVVLSGIITLFTSQSNSI